EEVCRKTNDGIQHIQLLDEVLADYLFGSATEENTMREKNNSSSVFIHVVDHVLHKGKVRLALRSKLAILVESSVFHELHIGRPIRGVRRIGNLNTELLVAKIIMLQGVSVVDIEVAVRNATQDHVHSGEIVCSRGQLLPIVVSYIRVVFQAKQQRAGT